MPPARLSVVVVAALLACGRAPTPSTEAAVADPPPAAAALVKTEAAATVAIGDDEPIGVEPCDRYVASYRRCIAEALPEEERPVHAEVVEGQRVAWARARGDEVLAAGLADACEAARAAARVAVPHCKHFKSGS